MENRANDTVQKIRKWGTCGILLYLDANHSTLHDVVTNYMDWKQQGEQEGILSLATPTGLLAREGISPIRDTPIPRHSTITQMDKHQTDRTN